MTENRYYTCDWSRLSKADVTFEYKDVDGHFNVRIFVNGIDSGTIDINRSEDVFEVVDTPYGVADANVFHVEGDGISVALHPIFDDDVTDHTDHVTATLKN